MINYSSNAEMQRKIDVAVVRRQWSMEFGMRVSAFGPLVQSGADLHLHKPQCPLSCGQYTPPSPISRSAALDMHLHGPDL
jgi:hypothetical protein